MGCAKRSSGLDCYLLMILAIYRGFLDGSAGKVSTRNAGDIGDDSLEEEMAAHSSVLA